MEKEDNVIILSDEDEECSSNNDSVLIIEDPKNRVWEVPKSRGVLEEDLVITFSQRAEVLPHARYDCSTYTFTPTDGETGAPVGNNQLICEQCYCYVCDKPAKQCVVWSVSGMCHCNAHKRSVFWRNSRDKVVMGYLHRFQLDLLEIDTDLRLAESLLLAFEAELLVKYTSFLRGSAVACSCSCHTANSRATVCQGCQSKHYMVYDYSQVFDCVQSFLNRADREKPKAAAVMRLGAAHFFISHCRPPGLEAKINVEEAKFLLLQRVSEAVQRQLVVCDFRSDFIQKLQNFYQSLPFPPHCATLSRSLTMRSWKDPLLVAVLRGQNVSGVRQGKRVKDILVESAAVILLRVHMLELQHRYRELIRYLKVVQTTNGKQVSEVRDLIPFYQCKVGDFGAAVSSLFAAPFQEQCCSACRLTPHLFTRYLRIFSTATTPAVATGMATKPILSEDHWEPISGAVELRRSEIVRFSVRVLKCNKAVSTDSQCWVDLLYLVNSPSGLPSHTPIPEPSPDVLQGAINVINEILLSPSIQIPRSYLTVCPDQALLLLATEVLALRIMEFPLSPALPILLKYEVNVWCLRWLFERVSSSPAAFRSFLMGVVQELNQSDMPRHSPPAHLQQSIIDEHSYSCKSLPFLSGPETPPHKEQPHMEHIDQTLNAPESSKFVSDLIQHFITMDNTLSDIISLYSSMKKAAFSNSEDKNDEDKDDGRDACGTGARKPKECIPPQRWKDEPQAWRGRCEELLDLIVQSEDSVPFLVIHSVWS